MTVSEEGTAHSEYLFRRDKQLKDGYNMSQKNYRIVPAISKLKSKLVDKEQNISAKIVAQQSSNDNDGISAKEASVRSSSEHNLNGNIVKFSNSNGEYELILNDVYSKTIEINNNNGDYQIAFNNEIIYPKDCPPADTQENKKGSGIPLILLVLVILSISAVIGAYVLKTKSAKNEK